MVGKVTSRYISAFPTLRAEMLWRPRSSDQNDAWWSEENVAFLSSGRASVFHAVRHFGIRKPQKILVPSYHCGVEIEAILRAGADIEYYDLDQNMKVQYETFQDRLQPETKALFIVHYWGFPQDTREIADLCARHNILLIEDCAHAFLSASPEGPLGTTGDAAIYSFPKSLPVPDGGALRFRTEACSTEDISSDNTRFAFKGGFRLLLENMRTSRHKPLSKLADAVFSVRRKYNSPSDKNSFGSGETTLEEYNHGMSVLSRSILRRAAAEQTISCRRNNYSCLLAELAGIRGIDIAFDELPERTCPLFFPVAVEDRDGLEQYLRNKRIETFVFGRRLHPTLGKLGHETAQYLSRRILGLPVHQDLHEGDMKAIAEKANQWARMCSA